MPAPQPGEPRIAAVGPATAAALHAAGFAVDLQPTIAIGEALAEALLPFVRGKRVLLPRAELARETLPAMLRSAGAELTIVTAYRTVADRQAAGRVSEALPEVDAVLFASSSSVANLFALLYEAGQSWPPRLEAFTIGPVTSATLRAHGVEPAAEAREHTLEGLVQALLLASKPS